MSCFLPLSTAGVDVASGISVQYRIGSGMRGGGSLKAALFDGGTETQRGDLVTQPVEASTNKGNVMRMSFKVGVSKLGQHSQRSMRHRQSAIPRLGCLALLTSINDSAFSVPDQAASESELASIREVVLALLEPLIEDRRAVSYRHSSL